MADGSGVKQFIGGLAEAGSEVIKETVDVGLKALEQGVQSAVGSPLSPQQIQKQQQQDQEELAETRRKIEFFRKSDQEQKQVISENKQKEQQRLQAQQQQEQREASEKAQLTQVVATPGKVIREDIAETMPELKGGRGKGG